MPLPNIKKYLQVAAYVEEMIRKGKLAEGDRLPSDRALAESLNVTPVTVNKGLLMLAKKNLIFRKVGSGSFVSDPKKLLQGSQGRNESKIGMLIHARSDAYGMIVVRAVHRAAAAHQVKLRTACADGFGAAAVEAIEQLRAEDCASVIIPWAPYKQLSELAVFVSKCPVPITMPVLIPGLESHCIETPEIAGTGDIHIAKTTCDYFHRLGESRIAILGPDTAGDLAMKNKLGGYSEYVYKNGLDNLTAMVGPSVQEMDALAMRWSAFKGELAVFCYDDVHAVRFMTAMHKIGLSAPKDFRIIGDNDTEEAAFCDPPLSSGLPDYAQLGEINLKCALAMANGETWHSSQCVANMLVVRESCGGLSRLTPEFVDAMDVMGLKVITGEKAAAEKELVS